MKIIKTIALSLLVVTLSSFEGNEAANKGLEIAQMAERADEGFKDFEVDLVMLLKNANGQESTRNMTSRTLELTEDGDKSMIVFRSPKDVEGTAMLTYTHKAGADDQWLYLPAIARVKRISSDNKSGPFMGSEFAYEDLSSQEVEKYTYKFIRDEKLNGHNTAVVERYPQDLKSGYKKQVVWFNTDKDLRIERTDFYDRKGALLKTLTFNNYQQYLGKHWRAETFHMVNYQSKKETILTFEDYRFQSGMLTDLDFTQNSLKRAR